MSWTVDVGFHLRSAQPTWLLNVQEGNVIVFEKENDKIVIKSAKTLRDFKGLLKNTKKEETFDEIGKKAKKYVGKRVIQVIKNISGI